MASLLSSLVDNLAEGIHKIKCKDRGCFLEVSRTIQQAINVDLAIKITQTKLMKN